MTRATLGSSDGRSCSDGSSTCTTAGWSCRPQYPRRVFFRTAGGDHVLLKSAYRPLQSLNAATTSVTGVAHYTTRAQSLPKTDTRFISRASAKAWCPESRFMQPEDDDPRPVPPIRPRAEDCCKGSCDPCIFDIYDVALYRYQDELRAWEERQARRHGNRP